jgi:hypothetical protein
MSPPSRKAFIHQQGDACSPGFSAASPSRRPQRVRRRESRPSFCSITVMPVVLRASGLIRHVDRHLQTAATSRVPLFDRRHAW